MWMTNRNHYGDGNPFYGLQTFGETPNVTDVWENAKLSGKGFGEIFGRLGKLVLLGKLIFFRGN